MFKLSPLAAVLAIAAVQGATVDLTSASAAYSSVINHLSSAAAQLSVAADGFSPAAGTVGASSFIQSDLKAFVSAIYNSASGILGSGLDYTAGVGQIAALDVQITNALDAVAAKAAVFEAMSSDLQASASVAASGASTTADFDPHLTVGFWLYNAAAAFPLHAATLSALLDGHCTDAESLKPYYDSMVSEFSAAVTSYGTPRSIALKTMTTCVPSSSSSMAASSSSSSMVSSSANTTVASSSSSATSSSKAASVDPVVTVTSTLISSIESCSDHLCNSTSTVKPATASASAPHNSAVSSVTTLVQTVLTTTECSTSSGAAQASVKSTSSSIVQAASSASSTSNKPVAVASASSTAPLAANNGIKYSAGGAALACGAAIFLL